MKRFVLGFLSGAVVLMLCVLGYLRLGMADLRADATPPTWQTRWMHDSVHASVARAVPSGQGNPFPPTDENLVAGGKLYLDDCVGCHGAPGKPSSDFGATFYPPEPQLARDGTRYTQAEIYWIAKHGIRRTGMGEQASSYSDQKLWLLAGFISRITTLPPEVLNALEEKPGK